MKKSNKPILKSHSYHGIQEYDQRLPNWWLFTLYGTILFSIAYWFYYTQSLVGSSDVQSSERQLAQVEQARLAGAVADLDNDTLWKISRNTEIIQAGKQTFLVNCASCHGDNLQGGIGVNLVDKEWLHGSEPMQIFALIKTATPQKECPHGGLFSEIKKSQKSQLSSFPITHLHRYRPSSFPLVFLPLRLLLSSSPPRSNLSNPLFN